MNYETQFGIANCETLKLLITKSGTPFGNSAWVEGGARTHDIQNHNLTL